MDRQSRPMAEWGIGKKCAFLLVFCCFPSLVFIFISRFSDFFFFSFPFDFIRVCLHLFSSHFLFLLLCHPTLVHAPSRSEQTPERRKKTIRQTPIKTLTRAQKTKQSLLWCVCVCLQPLPLPLLCPLPRLVQFRPGQVVNARLPLVEATPSLISLHPSGPVR